jgi:hypothetical protein
VQSRRDKKAAKRLFRKLLKKQGRAPRVLITDKRRSYAAAKRQIMPGVEHRGMRPPRDADVHLELHHALTGQLRTALLPADHRADLTDLFIADRRLTDRPLFAIAEAAGDGWPERLAKAAAMLAPDDVDPEGRGVQLLADIKTIFDQRGTDKLGSADLSAELATDATGPWADYKHGKPIGQAQLAHLLKPFGVTPSTVRIGTATPKGYERRSFEEAFSRYLPDESDASAAKKRVIEPQHRHNPQPTGIFASRQPATTTFDVAQRNPRKSASAPGCGGGFKLPSLERRSYR